MVKNLKELLEGLEAKQYGYLYKDVEKQAKIMEETYGIPPFAIMENNDHEMIYRGQPTKVSVKIAFSRYLGRQLELIQWNRGECYHKEHLEKYGEGFYHVSMFVDNLEEIKESFKLKGITLLQEGYLGKQHFAYFDSLETFGIILEFQETTKRRRKK